jgi:site-specific recombinase XerD
MSLEHVQQQTGELILQPNALLPALIVDAGDRATERFVEFFTANIRNLNTRMAYARAVWRFMDWCQARGLGLQSIRPMHVAAYIEHHPGSPQSVKQALAAIRMLFDWLVIGQVVPTNPATSVRGPKYVIRRGKTPVLTAEEARKLLDSINTANVVGLRDRALIGAMCFSFARVGAVVGMNVEDYYHIGRRGWLRLHEKGGKFHEVPAHHKAEEYLDEYLKAACLDSDKKGPLFRSAGRWRTDTLTDTAITRTDVLKMVKRRAAEVGFPSSICCHTFRATGITAYLENGGTLEHAQMIAAHESPRTTKLYDRTGDKITLDEIEKIVI